MSLVYTFNDLNPVNAELSWVGLDNYVYLFREDPDYVPTLLENLKSALYSVPSILVFSMVVYWFGSHHIWLQVEASECVSTYTYTQTHTEI